MADFARLKPFGVLRNEPFIFKVDAPERGIAHYGFGQRAIEIGRPSSPGQVVDQIPTFRIGP